MSLPTREIPLTLLASGYWRRKWVYYEPISRPTHTRDFTACGTFLTVAGEHTDPFTLQYTAGHDNIKTTMR
jgi:hypothetical protein